MPEGGDHGDLLVEPPATPWDFPPATSGDEHGVVGLGADLEAGTLLAAYRAGIFPMPLHRGGPMAWWSPDPRGIIPLDDLRVSRSLHRSCRRYQVRVNTAFEAVIDGCADRRREHGWVTPAIRAAYVELHRLGWAHSVETWASDPDTVGTPDRDMGPAGGRGELVGGLYGVAIGGLFAGESMFHRQRDASKVALVRLVQMLRDDGRGGAGRLLDVQWRTEHLASLGAVEVPARRYLELLGPALALALAPALIT